MMQDWSQKQTTALPLYKKVQHASTNTEALDYPQHLMIMFQLKTWERNLLQTTGNTRATNDVTTRIIESDKTYMVSDGGMINGYGSYGWIIANDNELTRGRSETDWAKELMQSFQAEAYGMLAALK